MYNVLVWFTRFTSRIQKKRVKIMANSTRNGKKTIELREDQLIFRFPEVHEDAELEIEFQRTLRIPDDNREHYLPPGLGRFPLSRVDDYPENLPDRWSTTWRGVFTDVPSGGAVDQFPRRLSDGGEDSGGQGERGDRGDMGGGTQRGTTGLRGGAGSTVVGRVLRGKWLDSAVRGNAVGGRLHGGGTTNGRGGARRTSDRRLPLEAVKCTKK